MPESLRFDRSDVADWADMLVDAAGAAPAEARKVVDRGALNIRTDARRRRAGSVHFPLLTRAITYESHQTPGGGYAEVGPEQGKPQGNLAHIPEYGALKTAPEPYMRPAAEAEIPRFEAAMEAIAVRPLDR